MGLASRGSVRHRHAVAALSGWFGAAAIALVSIGSATAVALFTDAFALPRGDDWAYRKIALDFSQTHHLHLAGWNDVSLLGQIGAVQPMLALFGASNAALSVFGVAAAFVAALLTYAVARELLPAQTAVAVVLTLAVFPSFALLSTSFMTDSSCFAAELGSVYLGLKGFRSTRRNLFLVSAIGLGFFAFTIREFALAAPVAVLITYSLSPGTPRLRALSVAAGFALACSVFYVWRQSLQPPVHEAALENAGSAVSQLGQAFFMLALGCLPVTVGFVLARLRSGPHRLGLLLAAIGAVAGLALEKSSHLLLGATVTRTGADWEGMLVGKQPTLFSSPAWSLIVVVALVSGCMLAYALAPASHVTLRASWHDPPQRLMWLFGLAQTALLTARAATGGGIGDRYLWPLLVVVLVMLLRSVGALPRAGRLLFGVAAAALAFVSLVTLVDSYSFAAARWHLGQRVVSGGAPARDVDAGFEWVGTHYHGAANEPRVPARSTEPRTAYLVRLFPRTRNCYVVSSQTLDDPEITLVTSSHYRPYGVLGRRSLLLYWNSRACPRPAG